MIALISAVVGLCIGAILVYVLIEKKRSEIAARKEALDRQSITNASERQKLDQEFSQFKAKYGVFKKQQEDFAARAVTHQELENENRVIKRDLANIDTSLRKLELDRELQASEQLLINERSQALAERYLAEVEKWIGASINANNYAACKQRLLKVIEWCREIGFQVPEQKEEGLLAKLKADYEEAVRAAIEREEQARIKAQIREEEKREKEIERELQTLERERAAVQAALAKALADAQGATNQEVERLRARLAEAESKQRAVSQAQLTKAGHIYVISNVGAFGDSVFKIGMTRRLDPQSRILELGDASVPFPFDVHMMISCENAPALENSLHREFHKLRLNKVNPRKEFFRVELEAIRSFVEKNYGEVKYTADAEALQYRQSLTISEEDQEYIEKVFEKAEDAVGVSEMDADE